MFRKPKICPFCLNKVKRATRFKRGEIVVTINGKTKTLPPTETLTLWPCGHIVEKRITNE